MNDADEFKKTIKSFASQSRKIVSKHLKSVIEVIDLEVACLGSLATECLHLGNRNTILSRNFPAKDLYLGNMLTNIVNTAICIVNLCENGFDNQARALVRILDERIYQAILLFHSASDYERWHNAHDNENSKEIHYHLFFRKGRLYKRFAEIECEYGLNSDGEAAIWRKEAEQFYSESVHGTALSVHIGSWALDFRSERLLPATFGRASAASKSTLKHIQFQLFYFTIMLDRLLKNNHGWKPNNRKPFIIYYSRFYECLTKSTKSWLRSV